MDWLDDENIEDFLDSSQRVTMFPIARNRYGILGADDRWLGLVVARRGVYDAFCPRFPQGTRVASMTGALSVIELSAEAVYREPDYKLVGEEATDGD